MNMRQDVSNEPFFKTHWVFFSNSKIMSDLKTTLDAMGSAFRLKTQIIGSHLIVDLDWIHPETGEKTHLFTLSLTQDISKPKTTPIPNPEIPRLVHIGLTFLARACMSQNIKTQGHANPWGNVANVEKINARFHEQMMMFVDNPAHM